MIDPDLIDRETNKLFCNLVSLWSQSGNVSDEYKVFSLRVTTHSRCSMFIVPESLEISGRGSLYTFFVVSVSKKVILHFWWNLKYKIHFSPK